MIAPFVDAAWVAERLGDVVLCDVRWYLDGRSGRAAYDGGHLPGAIWVDLETDLSAQVPATEGRHPLPAPEAFATAMAALGVGDADTVVAYDDDGGAVAARLAWMLRATGREATLLDGGIQAWAGPLSTASVTRPPARFTPRPWPAELLVGIDEAATTDDVLIDARSAERYAGAPDEHDPRFGHIPGARSLPTRGHLGPDGRLQDVAALRARFASVGIEPGAEVVSYCGGGVTACHNLLIMEHAGLGPGRLYPGSWSQWSRDPTRPIATGEDPGPA
jgi:thiosulfate/3-mercaptopyruvate sulfurtransferase